MPRQPKDPNSKPAPPATLPPPPGTQQHYNWQQQAPPATLPPPPGTQQHSNWRHQAPPATLPPPPGTQQHSNWRQQQQQLRTHHHPSYSGVVDNERQYLPLAAPRPDHKPHVQPDNYNNKPTTKKPICRADSVGEEFFSPLQSPFGDLSPTRVDARAPNPNSHVINYGQRDIGAAAAAVSSDGGGRGGEKRRGLVLFGGRRKNKHQEQQLRREGGGGLDEPEQMVSATSSPPSSGNNNNNVEEEEGVVARVGLALRLCELAFSVLSFSVMATNRTQGWSGDSFDRYKEYRFCFGVNIVASAYSAFQVYDILCSHLITGKHVIPHRLRYRFNFIMDQILAYLLLSATSASASRIDDWQTNWGKDQFTEKATISVSMAFLAFVTFALSSLISVHNLRMQSRLN